MTLITRLEQAEAGSRELDAEIAALIHVDIDGLPFEAVGEESGKVTVYFAGGKTKQAYRAPAYSTSLDAAMSLVPEGWWREIKGPRKYLNIPTSIPNYWSVSLESWEGNNSATGWAATPALALVIASLKAAGHD